MYTLFHNKDKSKIEVKKVHKALQNLNFTEEVTQYNACYFICIDKKPLIDKAENILNEWISETESKLKELKSIKI